MCVNMYCLVLSVQYFWVCRWVDQPDWDKASEKLSDVCFDHVPFCIYSVIRAECYERMRHLPKYCCKFFIGAKTDQPGRHKCQSKKNKCLVKSPHKAASVITHGFIAKSFLFPAIFLHSPCWADKEYGFWQKTDRPMLGLFAETEKKKKTMSWERLRDGWHGHGRTEGGITVDVWNSNEWSSGAAGVPCCNQVRCLFIS